jgi:HSP20 family molecular chaperone IbpA
MAAQHTGNKDWPRWFIQHPRHQGINMFYALAARPSRSYSRTPAASAGPSANGALEKFLSDTLSSPGAAGTNNSAAVEDRDQSYALQLDVPGLTKEQLDIGIEGDVVRVTSKADAPRSVKTAWRFPLEIDVATSTAKLENGVLTLTLGKKISVSNVAQLAIQ